MTDPTTGADRSTPPSALVSRTAPNFKARSTMGDVSLSDFDSKWVLLFFHPADFTPVCTSEFVELARRKSEFDTLNVQLLGVSIDSVFSHMAWVEWIQTTFHQTITFPIIEDISMRIAGAYGLIELEARSTEGSRACCFISPERRIEAVIHYPMQIGRSIDEIIRVFQALQETRQNGTSCPANWQLGDKPMRYPSQSSTSELSWLARAMNIETHE